MNIKSLERIVYDRTDLFNDSLFNKNVARVIRTRRLEANMTQSEIAEGICSISYISKIENGECPPDNFYVREVMSKMGITLDEVMVSEYSTELYEMIEAVYYDDIHKVQLLLDLTEKAETLASKLIQIVGKLFMGENIFTLLEYINAYKSDLSDFELMVYMYCIAKHEAQLLRYKKAEQYLCIILEFDDINHHLQFLVYYLLAQANLYQGKYITSIHYLRGAEKFLADDYEIQNLYRVRLLYVEILIHTKEYQYAEEELNKFVRIHSQVLEEKMYLLRGLVEYHKNEYSQAVNHFLKAKNYYFEESILFTIRVYAKIKAVEKVIEYAKVLEEGTNLMFYLKMGEYYKIEMEENLYETREFINRNLLSNMKKYDYAYLNDEVLYELISFHRHNSRYKAIDELRSRLSI